MPEHYHGTAFSQTEEVLQEPPVQQNPAQEQQAKQSADLPESVETAKKQEGGLLSSLFSGFGGLRSDDLLLLALIVLLWSSGDKDGHGTSDILPLLVLLLFIG